MAAFCCALTTARWSPAQSDTQESQIGFPAGIEDLIPRGSELPPSIYMFDENGQLRLIPRGTYRIHELNNQSPKPTASQQFQFDSIEVTGEAKVAHAEINVEIKISTLTETMGKLISIPIELSNFHRTEPLKLAGIENHQLTYDEQAKTYVVSGEVRAEQIEITGKGTIRINTDDAQRSINFRLPRAPTAIRLTVNDGAAVGEISNSENEDIVHEPERLSDTRSILSFSTAGGRVSTRWGKSQNETTDSQSLEVEGDWKVNWEDSTIDVTLNVRSLSGNIEPFTLAIPREYSLSNAIEFSKIESSSSQQTAYVEYLVTPLKEPRAKLNIQLDYPRSDYGPDKPLALRGILVDGGIQETGTISIRTNRDNRLRWLEGSFLKATSNVTVTDSFQNRLHEFRYTRGNFELPIWMDAKSNRVRLKTNYEAAIRDNAIELVLRLNLAGTGVTGQSLTISLQGWDLDPSDDLSRFDSIGLDIGQQAIKLEVDELLDGLPAIQEDARQLEIRLVRARDRSQGNRVSFPLPSIKGSNAKVKNFVQVPGLVTTSAPDGAEIRFEAKDSAGINPASQPGYYQTTTPTQSATITHTVLPVSRRVRKSVSLELDLTQKPFQLLEKIQLEFSRGSVSSLDISSATPEAWRASLNSIPVTISGTPETGHSLEFAPLPSGTHTITLSREVSEPFENISLCIPTSAGINAGSSIPISLISDTRKLSAAIDLSDDRSVTLSEDGSVTIPITDIESPKNDTLHIQRLWVQTMIDPTQRRERIVASVSGASSDFIIGCKHWNNVANSLAIVDGTQITDSKIEDGNLRLPLTDGNEHTIEIWVWTNQDSSNQFVTTLEPDLVTPHSIAETYWQLIVPTQQHLLSSSLGAGRAMSWEWSGFFLNRVPTLSTSELENRFNTSRSEELGKANTYLFHSPLKIENVNATVAMRPTIWMFIGSATLILTSALVYIPKMRTPLTLLLAGAIVLVITAFAPDFAIIIGQVGILALSLTAILLLLRRATTNNRTSIFSTRESFREGSTRSIPAPSLVASTQTIDSLPVDASVEAHP